MEQRERNILWFFDFALLLKALNGALEILSAILVLVVPPSLVLRVVEFATSGEIAEDPDDVVSTALRGAAEAFAFHSHYLIALYLILHGIIKVMLVIGIFAGKRIAYPLFMFSLALFGTYEVYRGFVRHELLLHALAIFDFLLLLLTAHEYRLRYPTRSSSRAMQEGSAG